jgi:MFS family permease
VKDNNRYRFVVQTLLILNRGCISLIYSLAGPLIPLIMLEFGIDQGSAGWFASIAPLTVAIVAVPIAIIGARYSLKKTFAVGALLQVAGIFVPFVHTYFLLILTRVIFACGSAIMVPAASAITAEWFASRELTLVNGITVSYTNLTGALAFLITVPIALALSWRAPMVIYACIAFTCAIAWIIFGRQPQRERVITRAAGDRLRGPKPEFNVRKTLTQRSTILIALAVMGSWGLASAMGAWLPTYYHQVFNMPLQKASSIAAITMGTGIVISIVGGILPQRLGRRKPFLIIPGVFMGLTALCSVLFNNLAVIIIMVILFGIFSGLQIPTLYTLPFELPNSTPRSGAFVMFALQCGGNFGAFLGPLITGYMFNLTGSYLPGFIIFAVFSLTLLVTGLMLPETGPAAKKVALKPDIAKRGLT